MKEAAYGNKSQALPKGAGSIINAKPKGTTREETRRPKSIGDHRVASSKAAAGFAPHKGGNGKLMRTSGRGPKSS